MIPLKAEKKLASRAYVVWVVAALCTAALVRLALLPDDAAARILGVLAVVPTRLLATPQDPAQLITLLSSAFLHAGWVHLAGNLLYLLAFGPLVEARLGRIRFTGLYLIAGATGALAHCIVNPDSTAPLVGASGAIAGVLGAHLILEPRSRVTTAIPVIVFVEIASLPAAFVIAMWFVLQVASAIAPVASAGSEGIAWFAHLGGFATGVALAAVLKNVPGTRKGARANPHSRRSARRAA